MRTTSVRLALPVAIGVFCLIACRADLEEMPPCGRNLPSIEIMWKAEGRHFEILDESVIVLGDRHIEAVDAADGSRRWRFDLEDVQRDCRHLLATNGAAVVACGRDLIGVDLLDGSLRFRRRMAMSVINLYGPPLLVHISNGAPDTEVVGIDPDTGDERGRWRAPASIVDEVFREGVLVVKWMDMLGGEPPSGITAVDGLKVEKLWEITEQAVHLKRFENDVVVFRYGTGGLPDEARLLELRTGMLGAALPVREDVLGAFDPDDPWELEGFTDHDQERYLLRRNDPRSGKPVWVVDLPGHPSATHRHGDRLFIHAEPPQGRGCLMVVNWVTGRVVRAAYGFRDVRRIASSDDLMIAATNSRGVVAFSGSDFGPPESATRTTEDEVKRLLAELDRGQRFDLANGIAELRTLGRDACGHIADEVPRLGPLAVVAAAEVLRAEACSEGAAPLASRLGGFSDAREELDPDPVVAIVNALAVIGTETETEAIAQILSNPKSGGDRPLAALAALASIGGAVAERTIAEVLEQPDLGLVTWWRPPDASGIIAIAGRPVDWAEIEAVFGAGDFGAWARAVTAERSTRIGGSGGGEIVVFPDDALGGDDDLWVATVEAEDRAGASRFLGVAVRDERTTEPRTIAGLVEDRRLAVWPHDQPAEVLRVHLDEVERDSDGDGLTDRVEFRLRTNPSDPDTDGDGLPDDADPAPNATVRAPRNEDERIALAVFRQLNTLRDPLRTAGGLILVVGHPALEWRGHAGPVITLSEDDYNRFREEVGFDGAPRYFFEVGGEKLVRELGLEGHSEAVQAAIQRMGPDDRACTVDIVRGRRSAVGYLVIVRPIGGRWAIRDLHVLWVS